MLPSRSKKPQTRFLFLRFLKHDVFPRLWVVLFKFNFPRNKFLILTRPIDLSGTLAFELYKLILRHNLVF